jgi:hypothetical protein
MGLCEVSHDVSVRIVNDREFGLNIKHGLLK